jgi:hypothetical protein
VLGGEGVELTKTERLGSYGEPFDEAAACRDDGGGV